MPGLFSPSMPTPAISSKQLLEMQYAPDLDPQAALLAAKRWGEQAIAAAGGSRPRPAMTWNAARPLRVGYVSPDICQHTVGLLVKDVLLAHSPERVLPFVYSSSPVRDWVTEEVSQKTQWREVHALSDEALATTIQADRIDILVDLAGHTAGSRLSVFAWRPAPVLVSWLGYFASTGLPCMDAVLLDAGHAPLGTDDDFVETVHRMPQGRWCYTPAPWAPLFPMPRTPGRPFTFGSFNNTNKYNPALYDLWAEVLQAVPGSHLLLKWKTFSDPAFSDSVKAAFESRGIAADRLELREFSTHHQLLLEYADVDVALDPRPFSGGLTTFECLWAGVPVITWPDQRVVSRQTSSILQTIGHAEWIAQGPKDYVAIAKRMSESPEALSALKRSLRNDMIHSGLMSIKSFTARLENELIQLYLRLQNDN